jgi:branched-chain amino acid transport system permease protein
MSGLTGWQFVAITLLVYTGVNIIACLSLNLQYGTAGILNFAFIVFQAAGAYAAALCTVGPSSGNGGFQTYLGGWTLPFPIPWVVATLVGALLAVPIGLVGLRRLRSDYQALVFLVISLIATTVVESFTGLLNGPAGISLVPAPLGTLINSQSLGYGWFYVGMTTALAAAVFVVVQAIIRSPLGRTLRAMRDNEVVAVAIGLDVNKLRMLVFIVGGAGAALSGAVLVGFISAWSPDAWLYPETFAYFTALIIGGVGSSWGAILGAILVPTVLLEGSTFLPTFSNATVSLGLQWVVIGVVIILFLWFRPQGVAPEPKNVFAREDEDSARVSAVEGAPQSRVARI